jgi:hypothetical protein
MPARMFIIAQTAAVWAAMPALTATARRVCHRKRSKAHTNSQNDSKKFRHVSISHNRHSTQRDFACAFGQFNLDSVKNTTGL